MTNEPTTDPTMTQAQSFLDKGDAARARELYAQICRNDAQNAKAWFMFGAVSGDLGQAEIAENALERAIALDPASAEAHLALAHIHRTQGLLDKALARALRATELDVSYVEAWCFLGGVAGMVSDWELAERASMRALELDPQFADAHVNAGHVFAGTGRVEQAVAAYRRALEIRESAEAWFGLGGALRALGRGVEAEVAFRTADLQRPAGIG
jgi:tetratricopeptide (TPR) repeat protein